MGASLERTEPARCKSHPEAVAGWTCDNCQATLCPDCVTVRRALHAEYLSCGLCQGRVIPILVHRSRVPLAAQLKEAWRYPLTPSGLMVLAGLSVLLAMSRWLAIETFLLVKFLPTVIGLGLFWGVFFHVIRSTARGERELDAPDFSDIFADCVSPAVRGFVGMSLLWLPGLLYLLFVKQWDTRKPLDDLLETPSFYVTGGLPQLDWSQVLWDPVLWLIVLAGAAYLPMVLLFAAVGQNLVRMLNPLAVIGSALRLGRDFTLTMGVLAALTVAMLLVWLVAGGILWLRLPFLSALVAEFITCFVPIIMARVLGLLLYNRGDALGYGTAADYLEPVLGNTRPRAEPPPLREFPVAVEEAPATAHTPVTETLTALAQAVEAHDASKALALYPELNEPRFLKQVDPAHHLFVGQAATAQGQYELAVKALESAADVAPDGPAASRALVLLARVYAERLQEPERAASIYQYVVHRYPDTDASRFAQARLPPTS
ncbi:MAG TPA: tetratricopeptide repeat protein [Hyalangium sp.]|nr:tetratricopeptide repeat protein [Hyalangium sp.]